MNASAERPVGAKNIFCYGLGDFYGGGSFLLIGMLFIFFLTEVVGLSPAKASLVFAIGKIWDAISDPIMGYLSDNTRSRYGRRRIYLLLGVIPIFISFSLLWFPVHFSSDILKLTYYCFAYIFFSTVFTMVMVPYAALNAEMTMEYSIRTKMTGARIVFSQISALLGGTIPKIIINKFAQPVQILNETVLSLSKALKVSEIDVSVITSKGQGIIEALSHVKPENLSPETVSLFDQLKNVFERLSSTATHVLPGNDVTSITSIVDPLSRHLTSQVVLANEKGYLAMAILFSILYALPWIVVFLGTWELPYEIKRDNTKKRSLVSEVTSVFKTFSTIFVNKSFRIHIAMYICAYTAMDVLMALIMYYLKYNIQKEHLFPYCMGGMLITQICMLPVYIKLSNTLGKGFAFKMGLGIWGIGLIMAALVTPASPGWFLIFSCIIIGAGLSAGVMIPWAILPSVTDVDELITTQKRAGIYSGAMTLVRKLVQGVFAMPLVGFMLQIVGYMPNQVQTADTLFKMKVFFVSGPLAFIVAGIIVAMLFKITPQTHGVLVKEIERLKNGGAKEDADEDTRNLLKELTGIEYQKLYQMK